MTRPFPQRLRHGLAAGALALLAAGCTMPRQLGSIFDPAALTEEPEPPAEESGGPAPAAPVPPPLPFSVAGPLIAHVPLTLDPGEAWEALGPLWYDRRTEDHRLRGVPPLWTRFEEPYLEHTDVYVVPPLFSRHGYGEDRNWQVFQLIRYVHLVGVDDVVTDRFVFFPLIFWQNSTDPEQEYRAIMPFAGRVKGRLFRDEWSFILFPLYLQTKKRDVVTDNYVAPIVHVRRGDRLRGWQVWPLVGRETKDITTRTNLVGDVVTLPGHEKFNLLWPVYWQHDLGLGGENERRIRGVFPLWWADRAPARDHTAVLWPFFSWTDDREEGWRQWNLPFPVFARARGEGKTLDRFWPIYSHGRKEGFESKLWFWPLYRWRRVEGANFHTEKTTLGIVLYRDIEQHRREPGTTRRVRASLPFFFQEIEPDGRRRLQVPALFEPLNDSRGVRRNWSPLWSLYRREDHPAEQAASESLLWNLWREDTRGGVTRGSLLFGLVQYHNAPDARRWRLFGLGPRPGPPPPDAP